MARRPFAFLALALLVASIGFAQAPREPDVDLRKARQLRQKERAGQTLTPQEQATLQKAKLARQKTGKNAEPAKAPSDLKPLCDMTADERYKGQDGRLYGGGRNEPPPEHLDAALR